MKVWQSVSTRLTLTLLTVTLSSLLGLFLILDAALTRFFVRDAQTTLEHQAIALANHAQNSWNESLSLRQLANLSSQQGRIQVRIFDASGRAVVICRNSQANLLTLPPSIISKTLAGIPQTGQFQAGTDSSYPIWLYSTTPIQDTNNRQILGAVYVAMPLRRPREFADQVEELVMGASLLATTLAMMVGVLLSRTLTNPLHALHQQAQQLEAGDYTARSALTGKDELAYLSQLLDQTAAKLAKMLNALQAQETARRELVANVSHDLRTPLSSLRIGLEAITDGVVVGDKAQEYLKRACREVDYLSHLVEQLLLLAQADAGQLQIHPQTISVVAIAQECLYRMQPIALQTGIRLELHYAGSVPPVWVDPKLTGQMILNLLDNAIKYATGTKTIQLNILSPVKEDQQGYVPLQIQDHGDGIPAEILQHVTQRFYRGDQARPRGGLGLGLAIAGEICQLQGSKLYLISQPKQGTIVTLFLPCTAKDRELNKTGNYVV